MWEGPPAAALTNTQLCARPKVYVPIRGLRRIYSYAMCLVGAVSRVSLTLG